MNYGLFVVYGRSLFVVRCALVVVCCICMLSVVCGAWWLWFVVLCVVRGCCALVCIVLCRCLSLVVVRGSLCVVACLVCV